MYLQITTRCNMLCAHCCYSCTPEGEDMDRATFLKSCDLAHHMEQTISLGGGEPTIHPHFHEYLALSLINTSNAPPWIATNGKMKAKALLLADLARKGIIGAALSQDSYHDKIDDTVVAAFKKSDSRETLDPRDLRELRDVTNEGDQKPFAKGRAAEISDREGCCCRELFVDPKGGIWACGCQEQSYGTVYHPQLPSVSGLETTLWESESTQDKYDAVLMMGKLGPTSLTALIAALDHPLAGIRKISSTALGKLGTKATAALPSLLNKVSDSDTEVRKKALSAITQMGLPDVDIAIQPLTQALEDEQDNIRQIAAELLSMIEQTKINTLTQMLF